MNQKIYIQCFRSLLSVENFYSKYYQKEFHKFPKGEVDLTDLFDERDLQAFIQFMPEDCDSLKLIFSGVRISLEKFRKSGVIDFEHLLRYHKGGATLIVNGLNHHSNRLYFFSKYLENIFNGHVHTNFYGTPTNSRGFNPHSDRHDVFVLQLKGSKDWGFYRTKKSPKNLGQSYAIEEVELIEETTINAQDLLYVPRALVHAAKATEELSWHLTIGVTGLYWSELLKNIIDDNLPSQDSLKEVVPAELSVAAIKEKIHKLFKQTEFEMDVPKCREKFAKRFPNLGRGLDEISLIEPKSLEDLNLEMSFELEQENATVLVKEKSVALNLPYREKPLLLHIRLKACIQFMQNKKQFKVMELPGLANEEEQLLLCYYLWNNGFIRSQN